MDFGFSIDPSTLVCISKKDKDLYIDELLYKKGMVTGDIIKHLTDLDIGRNEIWADSAEPRLIDEIKRGGFPLARGVKKGKDSIQWGIDLVKQFNLVIPFYLTNRHFILFVHFYLGVVY